ncbi:hypothetical protein PL321_00930 [Caloramator sp. mosi_1]|nr:hypothetical protein [Caloramator sp. mosi_1]WDC84415.1 hypothetical protein PL321_00930 [Caloramator sp. mosi_1]
MKMQKNEIIKLLVDRGYNVLDLYHNQIALLVNKDTLLNDIVF